MLSVCAGIDQRFGLQIALGESSTDVVEQEGAIQDQTDALSRRRLRSLIHGPHGTSPS